MREEDSLVRLPLSISGVVCTPSLPSLAGFLPLVLQLALDRDAGVRGVGTWDSNTTVQIWALTLTRLAAEESEGPGNLEGHLLEYPDRLEQPNGTARLELVTITLLRVQCKTLDDLASATRADSARLLDAAEVDALEAR